MEKKNNVDIVMVYQQGDEDNPQQGRPDKDNKDKKGKPISDNKVENEQLKNEGPPQIQLKKNSSKTQLRESGQPEKERDGLIANMFPNVEAPAYMNEEQQYQQGDEDDPNIVIVYENQQENKQHQREKESPPNKMAREQGERPQEQQIERRDQAQKRKTVGRPRIGNLFMIAEEDPVPESQVNIQTKPSQKKLDSKVDSKLDSNIQSKIYTVQGGSLVVKTASQQKVKKAIRAIGILLLVIMVFFMIIFGIATEYRIIDTSTYPVNSTTHPIYAAALIFSSMFAIVGFGMIFMYFKKMTESALFTSIFIVSFSLLFSPLVQKFWFCVFIHGFNNSFNNTVGPDYFVNQSMGGELIYYDLYSLKLAIISAISQLVVLLAVYGRLSGIQLVAFSFLFNIGWSLNHYALMNLEGKSPDGRFYDDYTISSVYLFGACAGIFTLIFTKKPPALEQFHHSNYSAIFACFGAFFLFFTFCTTSILHTLKNNTPAAALNHIWMQGVINSFFSLSSNILSTFTLSVLLEGKFVIRWSIFGLIMGGVIFGSVSEISGNISAAIACGSGSGLLTVIFFSKIYPIINRETVSDAVGLLLMLATSIIATAVIAPIFLVSNWKFSLYVPVLANSRNATTSVSSQQVAGWALVYPAVTILIGSGVGLILSALLKCFYQIDADKAMTDKLFFKSTHGLRVQKIVKKKKKFNPKDYSSPSGINVTNQSKRVAFADTYESGA